MNFGFNSNVRVADALYHVQTEDRGPSHPFLDTVVYESGRVVYKRSTSYQEFVAAASQQQDMSEQLHSLLSRQHREVIAQLEAGTLSLHAQPKHQPQPAPPQEAPASGLDVRLANPQNWLVAGNVTLAIELQRINSGQQVRDAEVEALLESGKQRVHCVVGFTDASGRVTLKFPMPANVTDGACLVIRATDGVLYGELRFRLRSKHHDPDAAPVPQ